MTDSPAVRAPLDPKEQPILGQLLALRSKLELMRQDRSTYVKSHDVVELYHQVIEQVAVLNEMRTTKRTEQNRGGRKRSDARDEQVANGPEQQWTRCLMIASN